MVTCATFRAMRKSEAERCLQIKAPVRSAGGERSALQRVRFVEKWRAEDPAWICQVYVIEDVPDRNAEDEAITPVRIGGHSGWTAAKQRAARASTTPGAATAARAPRASRPPETLASCSTFCFGAESEGLGQP
jgi:hypothetical protein